MNQTADTARSGPADEPIEVVRIRLLHAGGSAVVRDLRDADILMARWAAHDGGERSLGFEVTFDDGCSLSGRRLNIFTVPPGLPVRPRKKEVDL